MWIKIKKSRIQTNVLGQKLQKATLVNKTQFNIGRQCEGKRDKELRTDS